MTRPRLLDLYSGAGGAARGYQLAGFHVTGVDINPQPRFAGDVFIQADALDYAASHGWQFDAIHASPPCQAHSQLRRLSGNEYPDLIAATRSCLDALGLLYVIENVQGAPLLNPVMLCGSQFGLKVYRHRFFESSILLFQPAHMPHRDSTPSAGNGASPKGFISVTGTGGVKRGGLPTGWTSARDYMAFAMGVDWMARGELAQAVPPAFTEYVGRQLLAVLNNRAVLCPMCEQPMADLGYDEEQQRAYWYCEPCEMYQEAS